MAFRTSFRQQQHTTTWQQHTNTNRCMQQHTHTGNKTTPPPPPAAATATLTVCLEQLFFPPARWGSLGKFTSHQVLPPDTGTLEHTTLPLTPLNARIYHRTNEISGNLWQNIQGNARRFNPRKKKCRNYPLVNSHMTTENHHVSWTNPLFLWQFSSSQTVNVINIFLGDNCPIQNLHP